MNDDRELEAALRRVMAAGADATKRAARIARRLDAARCRRRSARCRLVAGGADGLEFRAGLAARRGTRLRGRARHHDRPVEPRHAASPPISISCASRRPTMTARNVFDVDSVTGLRP